MSVVLEPNSLYIATQMLDEISTEKFHWSFFITDAVGGIVQHQWSIVPGASYETYQYDRVSELRTVSGPTIYLLFTKIAASWTPPAFAKLEACLSGIFEDRTDIHYSRNRLKGLSCRTWITKALRIFVQKGWLSIPTKEAWLAIEPTIINRSCEAALRYLELEKTSQTEVEFKPSYDLIEYSS